jgi:hypothetical protein
MSLTSDGIYLVTAVTVVIGNFHTNGIMVVDNRDGSLYNAVRVIMPSWEDTSFSGVFCFGDQYVGGTFYTNSGAAIFKLDWTETSAVSAPVTLLSITSSNAKIELLGNNDDVGYYFIQTWDGNAWDFQEILAEVTT